MKITIKQHSPAQTDPNKPLFWKHIKLDPTNNHQKMLLKKFVFERLVQERKLSLVLDLDHTLLHSVNISRLTPEDRDLFLKETNGLNLSSLFRFKFSDKADYVIKLRPGLGQFLKEASEMFQLHVFTKGCRGYAMQILKLIDPENCYFGCKSSSSSSSSSSSRVFTRESCVGKKSLDLVMARESGILILDDKIRVWRDDDQENVLEIPRYNFFKLGSGGQRLSEGVVEGSDESENEGWLNKYFKVLMAIHAVFFYSQGEGRVLYRDSYSGDLGLQNTFNTLLLNCIFFKWIPNLSIEIEKTKQQQKEKTHFVMIDVVLFDLQ